MSKLNQKHVELIEIAQTKPLTLWNRYNKDKVVDYKINVQTGEAFTNPEETMRSFIDYLELDYKDSTMVKRVQQRILNTLALQMTEEELTKYNVQLPKPKTKKEEVVNN